MIGREHETTLLQRYLKDTESRMIAVIGRRRVGKTYLIESSLEKNIIFHFVGQQYADRDTQLANFSDKLTEFSKSTLPLATPQNWREAFSQLKTYLSARKTKTKKVIFFDELPWMDTHRSGFLSAFSYFWNDWAKNNQVLVIICGSAASWMIQKVINHKGGLHNRVHHLIKLEPFTLRETELFLKKKKINLNRYQISQLYMALGGIPFYLDQVTVGETAIEAIDRLCFRQHAPLRLEFDNLYPALFDRPEGHIDVIKALSTKWKGLSRKEIIAQSSQSNGGGLSKILTELEASSFITSYIPFGKKSRDTLYRLTDEYSLFYLTFILGSRATQSWRAMSQKPKVTSWQGYAFESLCLKHIKPIKNALGIPALHTEESSYYHSGDDLYNGIQVDLLINRPDDAIHLCEMKYYNDTLILSKAQATQLRERRSAFQHFSKTKKQIFLTMITTYGMKPNQHSQGLVDQVVGLDELFV